jgi:hypothetical protein
MKQCSPNLDFSAGPRLGRITTLSNQTPIPRAWGRVAAFNLSCVLFSNFDSQGANMKDLLTIVCLLSCATASVAQSPYVPGSRIVMHADNAFPYDGQFANRLDRVLSAALPVMVEQDLFWYTDEATGKSKSVIAHGAKYASPRDPTLENYFLAKIRPVMEKALQEGNSGNWPLVTLYLDFKSDIPEHIEDVAKTLEKYDTWLTSSIKPAGESVQAPLDLKPLMVLALDSSDAKKKVFYDRIPVDGKIRIFGSVPKPRVDPALSKEENGNRLADIDPEKFLIQRASTYRRWWFIDWHFIEKGGQVNGGPWTRRDEERLRKFVSHGHRMGYFMSTYCLNGYSEGNEALDKTYNFGTPDGGRERWRASIRAGFDFVQTDQYEELSELIRQWQQ